MIVADVIAELQKCPADAEISGCEAGPLVVIDKEPGKKPHGWTMIWFANGTVKTMKFTIPPELRD